MKDFKYIGSFGKRGDGPMELVPDSEIPIQIFLLKDTVFLSSGLKTVTFTKTGKPVSETVFHNYYSAIAPFKRNFVVLELSLDQKTHRIKIYTVMLFSSDLKNIKTLLSFESPSIGIPNRPRGFALALFTLFGVTDDHLYVFSQRQDKDIFIFNSEGKQIKTIKVGLPKLKVTESVKNEVLDYLIKSRKYKIYGLREENLKECVFFREYLPSVKVFKIKDGIITIQTYEKKGNAYRFVLMDLNGKILKSLYLPVAEYELSQLGIHTTYCFDKTNYYYLVDNADAETWELHKETFTMDDMKR